MRIFCSNASNAKKPHLATNPHASPPYSRSTLPSQQLRPQISGSKHSHNHSGTTPGENKKPPSVSRGSASRNANALHQHTSQGSGEQRTKKGALHTSAAAGSSSMSEIEFHSAKRRVQDKARELSIEKSGSHTRVPLSAPKHPGVLNQKTPKHTGVAASATLTLNGGSATDSFQPGLELQEVPIHVWNGTVASTLSITREQASPARRRCTQLRARHDKANPRKRHTKYKEQTLRFSRLSTGHHSQNTG